MVRTGADRAQVAQKVDEIGPLSALGLWPDATSAPPTSALEARDVRFGNICQRSTPARQPAVERQCVQGLDVDDSRHVLLPDQRVDEPGNVLGQRAGGTTHERSSALIRTFQDALLAGTRAHTEHSYVRLTPVSHQPARGDRTSTEHSPVREIVEPMQFPCRTCLYCANDVGMLKAFGKSILRNRMAAHMADTPCWVTRYRREFLTLAINRCPRSFAMRRLVR